MNEERKIEEIKKILSQYSAQLARVEWQKKKCDGLKKILTDGESEPESNFEYGWEKERLDTETSKLCEKYTDVTDLLDLLEDVEQREILYMLYIDLCTQEEVAHYYLVHHKTIGRKHRAALIAIYDAMQEKDEAA